MLKLIMIFSVLIWFFIDRFKVLWSSLPLSNYITNLIALMISIPAVILYDLDLLMGLGIWESSSFMGGLFAILAITAGSSAIHELIDRLGIVQGESR